MYSAVCTGPIVIAHHHNKKRVDQFRFSFPPLIPYYCILLIVIVCSYYAVIPDHACSILGSYEACHWAKHHKGVAGQWKPNARATSSAAIDHWSNLM